VARREYPSDFEEIWKIYPRHIGKAISHRMWEKMRADGTLDLDKVARAVCDYSMLCLDKDERFIPQMCTWLRSLLYENVSRDQWRFRIGEMAADSDRWGRWRYYEYDCRMMAKLLGLGHSLPVGQICRVGRAWDHYKAWRHPPTDPTGVNMP
jgi:hypothetical protein